MADAKSASHGGLFARSSDSSAMPFVAHSKTPTDASSTSTTNSGGFMHHSGLSTIPEKVKAHMPKMRSVKRKDDSESQETAGQVQLVGPPGHQQFVNLPDAVDKEAFNSVSKQAWARLHR